MQLDAFERTLGHRQDPKRHVQLPGFDEVHEPVVAGRFAELHLDARPGLREPADDRRQDPRAHALVHADAQGPGLARRVGEQVGAGRLQPVRDRLDVTEQQPAGLGQHDGAPAARAIEQAHAERALERHHVLADRRLRVVQRVGGTVERALVGDGPEAQELAQAEVRERVREDPARLGGAGRGSDQIISRHDYLSNHIRLLLSSHRRRMTSWNS